MRVYILVLVCVLAMPSPVKAQWLVHDPGNFWQAVLIAERTLSELNSLMQQYQTIVRIAKGLGNLDTYKIPAIGTAAHDPTQWPYGSAWLAALNAGDPAGLAYLSVARKLEHPGALLNALPHAARQAIERAYATVEITDSVAALGGHQIAASRAYAGKLQAAINAFEFDVTSVLPGYHETTAILDKIAGGQLIARRQDMAINQLLSHILEQLLVRGKRQRDTEAASMNMRLLRLRDSVPAQARILKGAANDLVTWRQP